MTLAADLIACSEASREACWLLQLHKDLGENLEPLPIYCNPQGGLVHITEGIINTRTKYIDVCYHNSRHLHECGIINYSWISTNENTAKIFTIAQARNNHQKFTKAMGLW
jgi:hypothetical protein